jgi:hypothetical protein
MKRAFSIGSFALAIFFILVGGGFGSVSVVNGLTHEKEVKPGEVYEAVIILKNIDPDVENVKIYQTDYFFTAEGKNYYDPPGKIARSNASWLTLIQKRITLPPKSQSEVRYQVKVPNDPGLKGTYWSMIMVEEMPKAAAQEAQAKKDSISFGIRQVMRSGIQVVTHIGDTGLRQIKFIKTELKLSQGAKGLAIDVENTGERWLRPYLYADLFDLKGKSLGRFDGGRGRLFPGTSFRYTVDFGKIPNGTYKTLVVVDNKDENVFGAQYTLNFNAPASKLAVSSPKSAADQTPPKKKFP